jgi:hypothetical protein
VVRRYALICAHLLCFAFLSATASAQNALPVLPTGDAAVAGFSGTVVLGSPPPPEPNRIDKTYINLDGPSLRVIGLGRMGGPPQAQLVAAPKTFTATARQIGQVFSLALDDANPPNVYAAASSAYGLPIVVPDADGDGVPDRSRLGAPNAAFMPGLFGPVTVDGGPGSIWRVDGRTGAVTLFANVTLGGVPNSGPALGALAFDPVSHQIFVADRDTGLIHRFTLDGVERGRFDHGSQALSAAGLPPIGYDPRKRLNIESPTFDSANPATWAYAPPARRVFGMAVYRGRLYYAVAAGLRIWSISLLPDGSFGADARGEVTVPRGALPNSEVSEILFDDTGDMLVAERGAPTGAYDYKALAESPENRVLRFRPKTPNDPPSRDLWFPVPKEYAIGFPPTYRNDNGGIAIGYGYDQAGNINRAVCGGTLWSTGEQLRNARDRAIIQRLQPGGPPIVDGLQGNSTRLLRPLNEPPFETYFIDYDDRFDDPQTRGYLGDVVIWRVCGQAALPLIPVVLICPPGLFDVDGFCRFPLTCPAGTEFSDGCCGYRGCPASYVRINGKCVPPPMNCNARELLSGEGRCESPKCPAGMVFVSSGAAGGAGPNGLESAGPSIGAPKSALTGLQERQGTQGANGGCPAGTVLSNDQCQPVRQKPKMCSGGGYCRCPEGTQRSEDGTCTKSSGCGPHMALRDGECVCENDYGYSTDLKTCVPISVCDPGTPGGNTSGCCKPGRQWSQASLSCDPPPRCDPSDPTTLVKQGGQCVCKDGSSSFSGGRFNGGNVASGTALDGVFQSVSGQNCCPTGRRYNAITNKCDPGDPGKPHLTIVKKKPDSCMLVSNDGQVSIYRCTFTITITNDGTAPANIPPVIDTPGEGTIVDVQSDGSWNCGVSNNIATCQRPSALAPGDPPTTITVTLEEGSGNVDPNSSNPRQTPVTQAQNCAAIDTSGVAHPGLATVPLPALGDLGGQSLKSCDRIGIPKNPRNPPPVTMCRMPACSGGLVGPEGHQKQLCRVGQCDCASGLVGPEGHQKELCRDGECMAPCPASTTAPPPIPPPPPPPPPPTITVTCPEGTRMGLNGQCFFVDPGCQGPNCGQVNTSCPAYKSDGTCCNAREYQTGQCGGTTAGCAGGAAKVDGKCPQLCPDGSVPRAHSHTPCPTNTGDTDKAKKVHKTPRRPTTKPNSDNPAPSGSGPQFNIQIGPGFPGGGRPHTPTQPRPPSGGSGCGARCG